MSHSWTGKGWESELVKKSAMLLFILVMTLISSAYPRGAESAPPPTQEKLRNILAEFETYAEQAREDWEIPGMAIAIVQGDEIIFARGFGVKQVGGQDRVDENTIFQIGSTSKAFTAALMAMLVDENKVSWQDKVLDHLPAFQMYDPWVTRQFMIEDLMAQRSGLPSFAGDEQAVLGFDRAHIIKSLRFLQPVSSFRSQFAYQNGLFLVAAKLVEERTGQSWEENLQERLLTPLGMTATTATLPGFLQAKNVTALHYKKDGKITALPTDWPYHHWVYTYGPAGGINSNVMDMAKWLRLQLGKGKFNQRQLISEKNQEFLQAPKTVIGPFWGDLSYYCEAWLRAEKSPYPLLWHNGGTSGHKTMVAFVPQAQVGIVVLSNLFTPLPESLAFRFYDLYFANPGKDWSKELLAEIKIAEQVRKLPPRPASPTPPLPWDCYTGAYHHEVYGRMIVAAEKDGLSATLGPKQVKMVLQPWTRDGFLCSYPKASDSADPVGAVFKIGPDGKAQGLRLTWDGGTEFKRQ